MTNETAAKTPDRKEKVRRKAPIKVVLRRLPRGMRWDELRLQLDPLPETEYEQFIAGDPEEKYSLGRAYFVFKNDEDIVAFRDRFNGYVFIDSQGSESMAVVELAPNPKVPRHKLEEAKKRDRKCGTLEAELEYKRFDEERDNPSKTEIPSLEARIKELEDKEKALIESAVQDTPLTQYLIRKNEEKFKRIQEKRRTKEEERRLRLQKLYEKEQKERLERKERKITEYRNSRFDRARDVPSREKKSSSSASSKDVERDRREEERSAARDGTPESRLSSTQKAERPFRNERPPRKERTDAVQANKERDQKFERSAFEKKERTAAKDSKEDSKEMKQPKEKPEKARESHGTTAEERSKPPSRVVRTVVSSTAASKSGASEGNTEKTEASAKPRRNKDRPERAIYQPSAARRRVAAAAAAAASLGTIAENGTSTTTEKAPAADDS